VLCAGGRKDAGVRVEGFLQKRRKHLPTSRLRCSPRMPSPLSCPYIFPPPPPPAHTASHTQMYTRLRAARHQTHAHAQTSLHIHAPCPTPPYPHDLGFPPSDPQPPSPTLPSTPHRYCVLRNNVLSMFETPDGSKSTTTLLDDEPGSRGGRKASAAPTVPTGPKHTRTVSRQVDGACGRVGWVRVEACGLCVDRRVGGWLTCGSVACVCVFWGGGLSGREGVDAWTVACGLLSRVGWMLRSSCGHVVAGGPVLCWSPVSVCWLMCRFVG
jgi:hypothetical protein